jgi:hypothetical protein
MLAVDLCRRCVESLGTQSETVPQFRQYVRQAVSALQALDALLAAES